MSSLEGKVAVVTGAGRGIGAGIAGSLAQAGAQVVCADLDQAAAEATAESCGRGATGRRVDVSHSDECDALIARTADEFGRLDIVVNNAGINRDAMIHKMTNEQWSDVIAVDLTGVFYLCRSAARVMREQHGGRIINISSISWMGNIGQSNYAAAKAGVVGLTRTLAKELARHGITANAICPGFIDTEMTRAIPQTIYDAQLQKIPLKRVGTPADIGNLVAFLSFDESGYITGEVINVGGGYYV